MELNKFPERLRSHYWYYNMSKPKWVVRFEYTIRHDHEDYEIEYFEEIEISVVRYGTGNVDKIVLFDNHDFAEQILATRKSVEWHEKVAKTICDALNKAGL